MVDSSDAYSLGDSVVFVIRRKKKKEILSFVIRRPLLDRDIEDMGKK